MYIKFSQYSHKCTLKNNKVPIAMDVPLPSDIFPHPQLH